MNIQEIAKSGSTGALKVARKPADVVLDRVPENRITSSVRQVLDRADAAARGTAGTALGDQGLKTQANEARVAADERARASDLKAKAEQHNEEAAAKAQRDKARRRQAPKAGRAACRR